MKLAVISLIKDSADAGGPIGLLPLFSRSIVDAQIDIARQWGAKRIIFLSEAMHGAILSLVDEISATGIEAEISRSARDLLVEADVYDKVLYLGDGILPGREVSKRIESAPDEMIFVAGTDDRFAEYERIDINNRWLGVGVFSAARLAGLSDIPDDWDTGSALLRTAVQDGAARDLLPDRMIAEGAVVRLESDDSIIAFEKAALRTRTASGGNFLDRFIRRPLQRLVVPRLWGLRNAAPILLAAPLVTATAALVCAWFDKAVAAFALLLITMLLMNLRAGNAMFENITANAAGKSHDILRYAIDLLALTATALLIFRQSSLVTMMPNYLVLILGLCIYLATRRLQVRNMAVWVRPDRLFILLILLVFSLVGQFIWGLYAAASFSGLFLISGSQFAVAETTRAG